MMVLSSPRREILLKQLPRGAALAKTLRLKRLEKGLGLLESRVAWRHPMNMIHAITSRCNASCAFCAWKDETSQRDELTTTEIKTLYKAARQAGFVWLTFWGGEPLMRSDIDEISSYASHLGFTCTLVTNGSLLAKKMDRVVPYLGNISISLDFASARHDDARGIPGLFDRIVRTVPELKRRYPKTKVLLNCTMMRANTTPGEVHNLAELAKELNTFIIFNLFRTESASKVGDAQRLKDSAPSQDSLAEVFTMLRRLKTEGYPIANSYSYIDRVSTNTLSYRCHWPKINLPMEANGDVVDCMHWGISPIANIREKPFTEILRHPRLIELAGECGEACHKCVSMYRFDASAIFEGNIEPLLSWSRIF
ncbi:MAG: hypothetical protein A2341_10385 [Deltaproteobacteria bacterium RIFOXYB12_FULL_58_9]|nr:MAG: hypothetical protein A2341_10385 [Deltaproteobacteria bacterium RIFOXYB12_FULL_58_9]